MFGVGAYRRVAEWPALIYISHSHIRNVAVVAAVIISVAGFVLFWLRKIDDRLVDIEQSRMVLELKLVDL